MLASRLVSEFGAQDVGAWLSVFSKGEHTRVASWNNANGAWDVLPAGHAMLAPVVETTTEVVVESTTTKPMGRRPRVPKTDDIFPSEE